MLLAVPLFLVAGFLPRRVRRGGGDVRVAVRLLSVVTVAAWLEALTESATDVGYSAEQMATTWLGLCAGWAAAVFFVARPARIAPDRVLIVGTGRLAERIVEVTRRQPELGLEVAGCIDDAPLVVDGRFSAPLLGTMDELEVVIRRHRIARVIVAFSQVDDAQLVALVRRCDSLAVDVDVVPRLFELVGPIATMRPLAGIGLIEITTAMPGAFRLCVKRAIDLAGSLLAAVIVAPLFAIIAAAIWIDDPGPILFRQQRVGRGGKSFTIRKFRTMRVDEASEEPEPFPDAFESLVSTLKNNRNRITRVGEVLRRTSLDELPQLLNVVAGEMSLIGPRPLRPFEAHAVPPHHASRFHVRPGITGLWQVNGRSDTTWSERVELDDVYVRRWSLAGDFQILAQTPAAVLRRRGAR